MLDSLRRGAKSWIAKALILLLIASFAVWGIGDIFRTSNDSDIVRVGDTSRSAEDFYRALVRQQQQLIQRVQEPVTLAQMREAGVDRQILAGLVRDAAVEQELSDLGVAVSDNAIRDAIMANTVFQDGQGRFSEVLYAQRLSQGGFNAPEFEDATRQVLRAEILQQAVARPLSALPGVAARIAAYRGEQRRVDTVLLDLSTAPDPGTPDEALLADWYGLNQARFREPERRSGDFLHVDIAELAARNMPTEDEVRAEYDANLVRYTTAAARDAQQIVFADEAAARDAAARLADGTASFAEIAVEQGIPAGDLDLGTLGPGDLPPGPDAAIFSATDTGVVGPVDTGGGWSLYNVTRIVEAGTAPFEDIRGAIAQLMASDRARTAAPELANRIDDLRAGGATLAEIAGQLSLPLGRIEGLARNGTLADRSRAQGLMASPTFIAEVFAALDGEERDQVQTAEGGYFVVDLERIAEPYQPALDDIRDRVIAAWQREQRLIALEARADGMVARLAGGDLATLAEEAGLQLNPRPPFSRLAPPPDLGAALVERLFALDPGAAARGRLPGDGGVIVAELVEVVPMTAETAMTETEALTAAIDQSLAQDQVGYFLQAVEQRHGAVTYPSVAQSVFDQLGQARRGF